MPSLPSWQLFKFHQNVTSADGCGVTCRGSVVGAAWLSGGCGEVQWWERLSSVVVVAWTNGVCGVAQQRVLHGSVEGAAWLSGGCGEVQ